MEIVYSAAADTAVEPVVTVPVALAVHEGMHNAPAAPDRYQHSCQKLFHSADLTLVQWTTVAKLDVHSPRWGRQQMLLEPLLQRLAHYVAGYDA